MARVFCKDCLFWDVTQAGTTTKLREGRCRRHAPTPQADDVTVDFGTVWPATFEDDWCGEGRAPSDLPDGQMFDEWELAANLAYGQLPSDDVKT